MLLSNAPRIFPLTIIVPVGLLILDGCSDIIDVLGWMADTVRARAP
jgi:hypothetical protein